MSSFARRTGDMFATWLWKPCLKRPLVHGIFKTLQVIGFAAGGLKSQLRQVDYKQNNKLHMHCMCLFRIPISTAGRKTRR